MNAESKVNILLVDDQPAKLLTYETILADLNENLIKAGSANDALQQLLKTDIAVVLLDVCMPEMDGFELAEMIRNHPRCKRTAIILVSAVYMSDFDRLRGYGCGAVDYVPVPIVPEVLRAKVSVFADLYRKTEMLTRLNCELEQRVAERTRALEAKALELHESEERLNLALDAAGAAPWDWEFDQACASWTERFRSLYGFASDEPASLDTVLARVHPDDRARLAERVERMLSGDDTDLWNEEFRILHPFHGLRWMSGQGRLIRDAAGRPVRMTGIDLDITDRRRAEEERAFLFESEREARALAEQANRIKDEFLATLSHELRTPINAIFGWLQLMRMAPLDAATVDEGIQVIERGAKSQLQLIDDLLDVSRITSGKFHIKDDAVDLDGVVKGAIDTVTRLAIEKGVGLHVTGRAGGMGLRGDSTRLQQVFWNLLTNAIKFTPQGGCIDVNIKCGERSATVTVRDTGCGIKPEFLPLVFERFRQADSSTSRRHGGLGIGLAISKHIVELHRGEIQVHSDGEGRGACFSVSLPLADVKAESPEKTPDGPPQSIRLSGTKVLVIDDDSDTRTILARTFRDGGCEVSEASNAEDAISTLMLWHPDLLVCDIGMPIVDGYALIRRIRALPEGSNLPVIALTAYARAEDRDRALSAGFDRHLTKPVHLPTLMTTASSLIRQAQPAEAARLAPMSAESRNACADFTV